MAGGVEEKAGTKEGGTAKGIFGQPAGEAVTGKQAEFRIEDNVEAKKTCNKKTTEQSKSFQMAGLGIEKESLATNDIGEEANAPGRIRTCGLRIRNPLLYPAELRALFS